MTKDQALRYDAGTVRFTVTLCEFADTATGDRVARDPVIVPNVTIRRAWMVAHRWARKGAKRFGGSLAQANWGIRGGAFPRAYRSASISLHMGRA